MKICRKVNLIIALLLVAICVCAQKVDFSYYTTTDGISNNRVWGLTQDQQGFLWVATDALNRFDQSIVESPSLIFIRHLRQPVFFNWGDEL